MIYFLVGNGFDLNHKFPTRYIDFLNTVKFLAENDSETLMTVGHVFGHPSLQKKNAFIEECYNTHKSIYDATALQRELIDNIISVSKNNMWFKYFCGCVSKDIKWIDLEKEILRVLDAFENFFDNEDELYITCGRVACEFASLIPDVEDRYILSNFDFFLECTEDGVQSSRIVYIKDEYVSESIVGSNAYYLLNDEIVLKLYLSLRELSDLLRDYLKAFVDEPSIEYSKHNIMPRFASLPTPNRVYSFNYTNTFEHLYQNNMIEHIHGSTCDNIVLGINPDKNDELDSIDTTFLQFKKYFQRVFFKTDITFLKHITNGRKIPQINDNTLYVIGHSLDSTDEDVIKQIFETAQKILILYHSETSVKNQIRNLVEIYGKEGLDRLRKEKGLLFLPQSDVRWVTVD